MCCRTTCPVVSVMVKVRGPLILVFSPGNHCKLKFFTYTGSDRLNVRSLTQTLCDDVWRCCALRTRLVMLGRNNVLCVLGCRPSSGSAGDTLS